MGPIGPQGEKGESGGVQVPAVTDEIIKTVDLENLQSEIDLLPKLLMADVTFNVNPGTVDQVITIKNFTGCGMLNIIGAADEGRTTHNVTSMALSYCTNPLIKVQGFNAVGIKGNAFGIAGCTKASLYYCNSMAGTSSTLNLNGVSVSDSIVLVDGCNFSNKYCAIRGAVGSRVSIYRTTGNNNYFAYSANSAGIIHKVADMTLSGSTADLYSNGGLIIEQKGMDIGV
jgi:hypothetical protein